MSLLITLKRGRKTKTIRCNPSSHRGHKKKGRGWLYRGHFSHPMDMIPLPVVAEARTKKKLKRDLRCPSYKGLTGHFSRVRVNPGAEQTELKLFIDNDGDLYRQQTAPIQKNLTKKFVKKTYNHKLAVKLWKYLADAGAKKYAKDFSIASDWNTMFSVADRNAVAQELADDWLAEMKSGNRHNPRRMRRNPRVAKTKLVYVVQGNYGYGHGWEDENEEDNWPDAKRSIKEYRENGPGSYRLIKRRVPIASNPRSGARDPHDYEKGHYLFREFKGQKKQGAFGTSAGASHLCRIFNAATAPNLLRTDEDSKVCGRVAMLCRRMRTNNYGSRSIQETADGAWYPVQSNPRNGGRRITKKSWYSRGGLANSKLFRLQKRGVWHYYTL